MPNLTAEDLEARVEALEFNLTVTLFAALQGGDVRAGAEDLRKRASDAIERSTIQNREKVKVASDQFWDYFLGSLSASGR